MDLNDSDWNSHLNLALKIAEIGHFGAICWHFKALSLQNWKANWLAGFSVELAKICVERFQTYGSVSGCHSMWAQNTKQKTNSQLRKSCIFLSSWRCFVIGCSFSALHFAPTWDGTLTQRTLQVHWKCFFHDFLSEFFWLHSIKKTVSIMYCVIWILLYRFSTSRITLL